MNLYDPILNLHKTRGMKYEAIKHKSVKVNNSFLCKPLCDWRNLDVSLKLSNNVKLLSLKCKNKILDEY